MTNDNRRASILTGNHPEEYFRNPLIQSCFSNIGLCALTFVLPCFPIAKTGEFLGEGGCCGQFTKTCLFSMIGFWWYVPCKQRGELRQGKNVPGSECNDCLLSCFCYQCVVIQNAKESGAYNINMGEQILRR